MNLNLGEKIEYYKYSKHSLLKEKSMNLQRRSLFSERERMVDFCLLSNRRINYKLFQRPIMTLDINFREIINWVKKISTDISRINSEQQSNVRERISVRTANFVI